MKTAILTVVPQTVEPSSERDVPATERRGWGFVGLAIAALVPALVWTVIIAGAFEYFGGSISTIALSIIGAAIAVFLALICAPLMLRPRDRVVTRPTHSATPRILSRDARQRSI